MPAALRLLPGGLTHKGVELCEEEPSVEQLETELSATFTQVVTLARTSEATFQGFEKELWTRVLLLGRLVVVLFLACRQQRQQALSPPRLPLGGVGGYHRNKAQPRRLNTLFGVVRYFRTYLRPAAGGVGHYPLDAALGLTEDRMSFGVLSLGARLATMMSFAKVHSLLSWFLGQAPSTEVLESTVLGLGRHTGQWFQQAPAPQGDGEVLIIEVDGKGAPTATEQELQHRRGPRKKRPGAASPRHRGRTDRKRRGKKPRRKKGDKSKNARMATVVVLYTLRRETHEGKSLLVGPINRWTYASFAPKRHAFVIARREADKRGFTKDSGKRVQLLTDGDEDLACYAKEYFPEALHTVDVIHVVEYLYKAGECLYSEGSTALTEWIDEQKRLLYGGQEACIVEELKHRLRAIPPKGPGNKGKRTRLNQAIGYLEKRLPQMNYQALLAEDLEIATGIVEGTVKNLIGARFDFGGCRWIRERAEALLQLRCIDRNGQWDSFLQWLHDEQAKALQRGARIRIQKRTPAPLPTVEKAA
jgi:hypothetical protein